MKLIVGSQNEVKVGAVREILAEYPFLGSPEVVGADVPSGVAEQPQSLEETIAGAMNRARACFAGGLSVGIESGLMQVPHTKTGLMDVCVVVFFDGRECHLGMSSLFECPKAVVDIMLNDGVNMQEACLRAGLTDNPELGRAEGMIGVLTKGRVTRKEYTKQALRSALIHLENAEEKIWEHERLAA
jgi:inosine/xanthosine triphosphatase